MRINYWFINYKYLVKYYECYICYFELIWQRGELTLFYRGINKETITFSPLHSSIEDTMEIHFMFTWQKLLSISWHQSSWPKHLHVSLNHGLISNFFFPLNLRCSYRYHLYCSWSSFIKIDLLLVKHYQYTDVHLFLFWLISFM